MRTVTCHSLDDELARFEADGYRLDVIGPADDPWWAEVSRDGDEVLLDAGGGRRRLSGVPKAAPSFVVSDATDGSWNDGRAGMRYRDLLPDRFGGAFIASHIHIRAGGPVPDYVHHHDLTWQLIFCHRGWVEVVYQDQGPAFVMQPGDLVLQPPGIRHRVLASSDDLYVVELASPAQHRTLVDHDLTLPTPSVNPDRRFGQQRFVRFDHHEARWESESDQRFEYCDTGVAAATGGTVSARLIRWPDGEPADGVIEVEHDLHFMFVVDGSLRLENRTNDDHDPAPTLVSGSCLAVPPWTGGYAVSGIAAGTVVLEVTSTVPPSTA